MKEIKSFGQRLRILRKRKGLSAKDLANACNCSPSLIYNIEKDYNQPQPEFIVKAASFFRVTSDFLLGIEEQRIISEEELINLYRRFDDQDKLVISHLLRLLGD